MQTLAMRRLKRDKRGKAIRVVAICQCPNCLSAMEMTNNIDIRL
jgi:hypothetical protein